MGARSSTTPTGLAKGQDYRLAAKNGFLAQLALAWHFA